MECLNISSRYKKAFEICRKDDYFTVVSCSQFEYICLPVNYLQSICIYVNIPTECFALITEVFDYEHD